MKLQALIVLPLLFVAPSHSAVELAARKPAAVVSRTVFLPASTVPDEGASAWLTIGAGLMAVGFLAARRRPRG